MAIRRFNLKSQLSELYKALSPSTGTNVARQIAQQVTQQVLVGLTMVKSLYATCFKVGMPVCCKASSCVRPTLGRSRERESKGEKTRRLEVRKEECKIAVLSRRCVPVTIRCKLRTQAHGCPLFQATNGIAATDCGRWPR